MSAVLSWHYAPREQQSRPFKGIDLQSTTALPATRQTASVNGAEGLNEQYVYLRRQLRTLLAEYEPDLLAVHQVNAQLTTLEEQMRLLRLRRH